jgi:hypothetical protein
VTLKLIWRQQDERTSRGRSSSSKSAKSRCGRAGDRGIVSVKERWLVAAAPLADKMWVDPYVSVHSASGPPAWPARSTRCTAAIPRFILREQTAHSVQHVGEGWPASHPVDGCKNIATSTRPWFVTARLISSRGHLRCSCRLKDTTRYPRLPVVCTVRLEMRPRLLHNLLVQPIETDANNVTLHPEKFYCGLFHWAGMNDGGAKGSTSRGN